MNHGSGVRFVTVTGEPTLRIVERLGAALHYTGQLALDLLETDDGLYLLECNPRATSGVHLLPPEQLIGGLTDATQPLYVAPPGRSAQLALPLLASVRTRPAAWSAVLTALLRDGDVIVDRRDPLPALMQLRMALRMARQARQQHLSLTAATTYDIEWNGE